MKTIVVSGAHSGVGKTSLALKLCELIPGAVHVKIGHGSAKDDLRNVFYHVGTSFKRIVSENGDADFLVIESNRILDEVTPDCTIYLTGGATKPSAALAEEKADIVRGSHIEQGAVERLCRRLGLPERTVLEIVRLSGAVVRESQG
ncbi:MAG: hypothetical protein KAX38_09765 [Candidatus Krumholzibacteria bacterium]|nr:hypothetical protein [Candidatus Krumholzibacteria bacterium]